MRRNKLAVWCLCMAMAVTVCSGLSACGGRGNSSSNSGSSNSDGSSTDSSTPGGETSEDYTIEGTVVNPSTPNTFTASRTDNREDAYVAYGPDGKELGKYKTIATAINTAVANDSDNQVFGSYVTRVGATRKLFINRAGYAENNDDMYWYYEDGNKLDGMDCWDSTNTVARLQNSNYIVHQVSGYGQKSLQTWNSYELYDENGELIAPEDNQAQSWELSSTMDAAVLQFTSRLTGITGLTYSIDLSGVKITPAYDGADKTYAFIGFYAWQDYYVLATGIACDVSNGNWYMFEATSRDDSFSDATYNMGECVMTSTWNEEGGYFTPDKDSLTMSAITKVLEDEEGEYQVDDFTFEFDDGTKLLRRVDDSVINQKFAGYPLGYENAYVFVAGLDIKNQVASGVKSYNTDYFNGAAFENLVVTEAKAHVPSVEEMSDTKYGYKINEEWRGIDHDILMASSAEKTDGIIDYAILNTSVAATYEKKDGHDVYSFSYNGEATSDKDYGAGLSQYQDVIDALSEVTAENVTSYIDVLEEVKTWKEDKDSFKIINKMYYQFIDFTAYDAAYEIYLEATQISEEGKAVADAFNTLSDILAYTYKGWTTDGADISGYLYTELVKFREIYANYEKLSESDKNALNIYCNMNSFKAWETFSTELETLTSAEKFVNGTVSLYKVPMASEKQDYTSQQAFEELLLWANKILSGSEFVYGTENDDGNTAGAKVMNGDNTFYPSLRVVSIVEYFEGLDVELPTYVKTVLETIGYEDFYMGFYYPVYNTVKTAMTIKSTGTVTPEQLAFLNEVWTNSYELSAQIAWNWNNGNKFETYYSARAGRIVVVAGGNLTDSNGTAFKTYQYFEVVANFLTEQGYTVKANGWGVTAEEIVLGQGGGETEETYDVVSDLLPADAKNFTTDNPANVTANAEGGYTIVAGETEGDWTFVNNAVTLTISEGQYLCYDLSIAAGGKCDVLLYSESGNYVYLGNILGNKTNLTGDLKGAVSFADLLANIKNSGNYTGAKSLSVVKVAIYVYDNSTVNVKALYIGTPAQEAEAVSAMEADVSKKSIVSEEA